MLINIQVKKKLETFFLCFSEVVFLEQNLADNMILQCSFEKIFFPSKHP